MKKYEILFVILSTFTFALIASIITAKPVLAKTCYDGQNQPIPCPKPEKKRTATDVPPTLTPIPTDTPQPTDTPVVVAPPASGGPQAPGSDQAATSPNPSPISNSFFDVFAIGGGLLIGFLLGGLTGYRVGISRIREAAINPDSTKAGGGIWTPPSAGSFFDDSPDLTSPAIGPKHDDPAPPPPPESSSFFDNSANSASPKIGPKHDDPAPPPPPEDATPSPDVHPDVDAGGDTGTDLGVNSGLPDST